jgi:hypothetical protein
LAIDPLRIFRKYNKNVSMYLDYDTSYYWTNMPYYDIRYKQDRETLNGSKWEVQKNGAGVLVWTILKKNLIKACGEGPRLE